MPIDAGIIAGLRPLDIKLTDPMEQYASGLRLKALMGQNNLQDIQQQTAQQNFDQNNAFKALFANGAQPTVDQAMGASPTQGMAFQKTQLDNQKTRGDIGKNTIDIGAKKSAMYRDALSGVNDPAAAAQWMTAQHNDPDMAGTPIGQNDVQTSISRIPQDQAGFAQWKQQAALGMTKYIEANKPQITSQNLGGSERIVATPGLGGAPVVLDNTRKSVSPDTQMFINQGSGDTGPMDLSKVSPADLQAGYRYKQDGTLPPNMGRGIQGSMQATKIRNIAAQLSQNEGTDNADVRGNQLSFKGSGAALNNLQKREAQVGANVRNFDFNANQVEQLSGKVDNTGVPVINGWLNAGKRSVQGNPDISAFDVAVKTTVNEFAQIVSGTTAGATTEGEKQKAEKLLNAQQTPDQVKSVLNQMRIESQNRMKSFADQKQQLQQGMGGNTTQSKPAQTTFHSMPDPASLSGKSIKGDDGTVYKSNGSKWVRQ